MVGQLADCHLDNVKESGKLQHTPLSQQLCVSPVEPRPRAGKDLDRLRQKVDQLCIPPAHLSSRAPKRPEDGAEVSPFPLFQRFDELASFPFGGTWADDIKGLAKLGVRLGVVPDRVSNVEDDGSIWRDR